MIVSQMPILDGLAATRAIRQKELASEGLLGKTMKQAGARLPIIAVTANVRKEQVDAAIAAGAVRVAWFQRQGISTDQDRIASCRSLSRLWTWYR
jgi:CheY-like chemotaxis protein